MSSARHVKLFITLLFAAAAIQSVAAQGAPAPEKACSSMADALLQNGNFGLLLAAADAAGLTSTLTDSTVAGTLLAPTDVAILDFLNFTGLAADDLLADPALADIISYHFVPEFILDSSFFSTPLEGVDVANTTALNNTLANYNGTLTAAAFQTAEGSDIFLFTVDSPSSAAYFAIPEGSAVALSPVTAAVVDVADVISTCNDNIYPINTVLLPDDIFSDTTLAFAAAATATA